MYRATRARRPLNLDVTTATTQSFAFIHSYLEVLVMIATGATPVLIGRWPHSFIPSNEALIVHTLIVLTWRKTHGLLHIEALDVSGSNRVCRTRRVLGLRPAHSGRGWSRPRSGA